MKRVDFFWRYQPMEHSCDAKLLTYLRNNITIIPLREKILQALRAFWLPFAYIGQPEARRLAIEAIYALEKHADYLRVQFSIEIERNRIVDSRCENSHESYNTFHNESNFKSSLRSQPVENTGKAEEIKEFVEFF